MNDEGGKLGLRPSAMRQPQSAKARRRKRERRWMQYSLKSLMIASLLLGSGLGWIGQRYRFAHAPRKPQGMIKWVDHRERTAYIEMIDERLARSLKAFSIYDASRPITAAAAPKATGAVTHVLGPRYVEVHFSGQDSMHPVQEGDTVYSRE